MPSMSKEDLINYVLASKDYLSNPGTRPTVDSIISKAQDLYNFINDSNPSKEEKGLIVMVAPDDNLRDYFFKGWKVEDVERLALEIANLGGD